MRAALLIAVLSYSAPAGAQDADDGYDFEAPIEPGHELEAAIPTEETHAVRDSLLAWRSSFLAELLLALELR